MVPLTKVGGTVFIYKMVKGNNQGSIMKKIKSGILLALVLSFLVGCASSGPKSLSNEYVTVENFQGVEIEKVEVKEATDENVDKVIAHMMEGYVAEHNLPEDTPITDEIVKEAGMSETVETVDELRAEYKKMIQTAREEAAAEEEEIRVWEIVLDNSEVKEYPEDRMKAIKEDLVELYENYAAQEGKTYEEYMEAIELTDSDLDEAAEATLKQELVANLIAYEMAIKPTDDEVDKRLEAYAEEYKFATVALLLETVPKEEMYEMILRDIVKEWLRARCVYVEVTETEGTEGSEE